MDKYLDKFLTEYLDTKRVFLGSEDNLRNYCERTWLKDHGWNNVAELYKYVADRYNISDRYVEFLIISFMPVTEEFMKKEKDYLCARHRYETLNVKFDLFLKEGNNEFTPACIVKYKCPYSEDESFSSVIDFDKPKKYSIFPSTEFLMTVLNLVENTHPESAEKASIVLFKRPNSKREDPVIGVTHYPFDFCKNIMYIGVNSLRMINYIPASFNDDVIGYIKEWIALNRNKIIRYWDDPDYSSEMLTKDLLYTGTIATPED